MKSGEAMICSECNEVWEGAVETKVVDGEKLWKGSICPNCGFESLWNVMDFMRNVVAQLREARVPRLMMN